MDELQRVIFQVGEESHEGHILPPRCGRLVYVQPSNWPEQNFPHLIDPMNIVLLGDEDG